MLPVILEFFNGRAKTRIYTTFLGWVLVFHIDIIFLAFFTDQTIIFEKTHQLKGEYVWSYIGHFGWWAILIEAIRLVSAVLVTYLMIWVIPRLINERSYKVELDVEYRLRKMKITKEDALNRKEQHVVKQQLENIESEKRVVTERVKLEKKPEQIGWDAEFEKFIKIANAEDALRQVSNTVYAEGGNLFQYTNADGWAKTPTGVDADSLALVDTNDLVSFSDKGKLLSLTAKGKYFIKKMNESQDLSVIPF